MADPQEQFTAQMQVQPTISSNGSLGTGNGLIFAVVALAIAGMAMIVALVLFAHGDVVVPITLTLGFLVAVVTPLVNIITSRATQAKVDAVAHTANMAVAKVDTAVKKVDAVGIKVDGNLSELLATLKAKGLVDVALARAEGVISGTQQTTDAVAASVANGPPPPPTPEQVLATAAAAAKLLVEAAEVVRLAKVDQSNLSEEARIAQSDLERKGIAPPPESPHPGTLGTSA